MTALVDEINSEEIKSSLDFLDLITRRWAIMSQFEQDLSNYEKLKNETDDK
jgi:hypothetical protein